MNLYEWVMVVFGALALIPVFLSACVYTVVKAYKTAIADAELNAAIGRIKARRDHPDLVEEYRNHMSIFLQRR